MGSQKQVEASRDGKSRKETVKQTEDDLSNEELKLSGEESSMSQISIETASLLLAMKLLKMVPPDFCIQPPSVHPPSQILTCLAQSLNLFCSKLSSHCLHLYTHPRCQRNFQSLMLPEEKWFGWELSDAPGGNWEPPVDVRVVRVRRICNMIRSQRMTGIP